MKMISVPGRNGLGKTKGTEETYKEFLKGFSFEVINLNLDNIKNQSIQIFKKTKKYFKKTQILFLGGDHSISYPLVLNFFRKNKRGKLIVFDAHPDLMEPFPEPTHEEWLRGVLEKGFPPKNVLIVGVRKNSKNIDKKEKDYAIEKEIKIIYSKDFKYKEKEILNFINSGKIYCSFDIDVFDKSLINSTGYPEKEGLREIQIFKILEKIKNRLDYFDLVEINFKKGTKEDKEKTKRIVRKILKTFEKI